VCWRTRSSGFRCVAPGGGGVGTESSPRGLGPQVAEKGGQGGGEAVGAAGPGGAVRVGKGVVDGDGHRGRNRGRVGKADHAHHDPLARRT